MAAWKLVAVWTNVKHDRVRLEVYVQHTQSLWVPPLVHTMRIPSVKIIQTVQISAAACALCCCTLAALVVHPGDSRICYRRSHNQSCQALARAVPCTAVCTL